MNMTRKLLLFSLALGAAGCATVNTIEPANPVGQADKVPDKRIITNDTLNEIAYVVEVDKLGMPARITLASEPYQPKSAQIGYFVGEIVRLARERPLDPVVMRKQWTKVYQYLAGTAVNTMNEFAANDTGLNALPGRGAVARTIEISNILQKSPDTYQVRWLETSYANGLKKSQEEWTGLFQVKLIPPRDEADAFKNPIGVYVSHFTWSREFAGPVTSDTKPATK